MTRQSSPANDLLSGFLLERQEFLYPVSSFTLSTKLCAASRHSFSYQGKAQNLSAQGSN